MPRSRDQRCRRVLNAFFDEQLTNIHYILEKLNVRGWKIARYVITIPKEWTVSSPRYDNDTRTLTWVNNVKQQDLPQNEKATEIEQLFKTKMEPHEKKTGSISSSYLRIHETKLSDEKIEYHFLVVYDKEHMPFPEEVDLNHRIEQLERNNDQMTKQLRNYRNETEQYVGYMRRRYNRAIRDRDEANYAVTTCSQLFERRNAEHMEKYRKIIRDCYLEMEKEFECPVCYETIPNDKVFTTPCKHVICSDCTTHCQNNCPMCRQEMCYVPNENNDNNNDNVLDLANV